MKTFLLILCILIPCALMAQEQPEVAVQGKRYIDLNIRSLERYAARVERQQHRLLAKLKRKEQRFARRLKKTDSLAYAAYNDQSLSYDSIARLQDPDSATLIAKTKGSASAVVDSLRKVQSFINANTASVPGSSALSYDNRLAGLQSKLAYQQYLNGLIDRRSLSLKGLAGGVARSIPAFKGMEKDIYYGRSKLKVWKQMADDPSAAEEAALEYLQGTAGFDKALAGNKGQGMQGAATAGDLEKMGYQTRRQMNAHLQEKFGSGLDNVQQKMGGQVADWQSTVGSGQNAVGRAQSAVGKTQQDIKTGRADLRQSKQSLKDLKPDKPSFKINPMRGLPFWKRVEKSYNFQTVRATPDGKTPALLTLSGMAGFRHTPRLSYGVGIAATAGLGKNWSNIRFTFEGLGLRSYAAWQWQYGIGAYAGYERFYKQAAFTGTPEQSAPLQPSVHNTPHYNESVLIGLTKSYKMNSKWNGAVQLLFDVWWKEKGLRSPIVLRFATISK